MVQSNKQFSTQHKCGRVPPSSEAPIPGKTPARDHQSGARDPALLLPPPPSPRSGWRPLRWVGGWFWVGT